MIQITYRVTPEDRDAFLAAIAELGASRRRHGGYGWSVMQNGETLEQFVEQWMEADWHSHLRHHDRVSAADRAIQNTVNAFHRGEGAKAKPEIRHFLPAHSLTPNGDGSGA